MINLVESPEKLRFWKKDIGKVFKLLESQTW